MVASPFPFFLTKMVPVSSYDSLGTGRRSFSFMGSFVGLSQRVAGAILGSTQLRSALWGHVSEHEVEISYWSQQQENLWSTQDWTHIPSSLYLWFNGIPWGQHDAQPWWYWINFCNFIIVFSLRSHIVVKSLCIT